MWQECQTPEINRLGGLIAPHSDGEGLAASVTCLASRWLPELLADLDSKPTREKPIEESTSSEVSTKNCWQGWRVTVDCGSSLSSTRWKREKNLHVAWSAVSQAMCPSCSAAPDSKYAPCSQFHIGRILNVVLYLCQDSVPSRGSATTLEQSRCRRLGGRLIIICLRLLDRGKVEVVLSWHCWSRCSFKSLRVSNTNRQTTVLLVCESGYCDLDLYAKQSNRHAQYVVSTKAKCGTSRYAHVRDITLFSHMLTRIHWP